MEVGKGRGSTGRPLGKDRERSASGMMNDLQAVWLWSLALSHSHGWDSMLP